MRSKKSIKDMLFRLSIFLLIVGNGSYVSGLFGDTVEYAGLILLILCELRALRLTKSTLKKYLFCVFPIALMAIGPAVMLPSGRTQLSMLVTTVIVVFFAVCSGNTFSKDYRFKIAARTAVFACVANGIIGLATGTLGLNWDPQEAILGFVFLNGFSIKNYCGGVWLIILILLYIYYLKAGKDKTLKNRFKLAICFLIILLSGSKGAAALAVLFYCLINYEKWIGIIRSQRKLATIILGGIAVLVGIYLYNNVFINVTTYAYRMRGVTALIENFKADSKSMLFGLSNIAYGNSQFDYTTNMRNYFGWQASVEMAYVNIFIKYGVLGAIAFALIVKRFFSGLPKLQPADKTIAFALISILLLSGFVETYMVTIHYVVGPLLYCLLNGIINQRTNVRGNN